MSLEQDTLLEAYKDAIKASFAQLVDNMIQEREGSTLMFSRGMFAAKDALRHAQSFVKAQFDSPWEDVMAKKANPVDEQKANAIKEFLEKGSLPIWRDVPTGTKIRVCDAGGSTILLYTTAVDIPAGSSISVG